MAALGLPLALLAGMLAELAAGAIRGRPLRGLRGARSELRLARRGARPSLFEIGGLLAALLGSGIVATAALRGRPGTAVLLYLGLVLAAAGAQTAAADVAEEERPVARRRLVAAAAEAAFVLALGASFLRWGAADLAAVRGAHQILGNGFVVGPPMIAAGAILAAVVLVGAGALRLPEGEPPRADETSPAGPSRLPAMLARWAAAGATALAAAAFLAGGGDPERTLLWGGVAIGAALLLGAVGELLRARGRLVAAAVLAAAAGGAMALVVLGG